MGCMDEGILSAHYERQLADVRADLAYHKNSAERSAFARQALEQEVSYLKLQLSGSLRANEVFKRRAVMAEAPARDLRRYRGMFDAVSGVCEDMLVCVWDERIGAWMPLSRKEAIERALRVAREQDVQIGLAEQEAKRAEAEAAVTPAERAALLGGVAA